MKNLLKKCVAIVMAIVVGLGVAQLNTAVTYADVTKSKNYTIKVNLGTNCVTVYNQDGKAIRAMICSPGAATPTGTFYIPEQYRWHAMMGNCYAQYCSRIVGGILFHSVWYYTNGDNSSMSVSAYNSMGNTVSHGCVRLLCKDAKWVYDHCAVGTKVVIFRGNSGDDPLGRPSFTPIRTGAFTSWDPTDPDPRNPYRKAEPKIYANTTTIEYGTKVELLDLVTIKDSAGNELTENNATIKVSGKINTKKLGKYTIKYSAKDSIGNSKTETKTFEVVDTKNPIMSGVKTRKNIPMGSSKNLLSGVKAKAVSGKNLTSKIKVSVTYKKKKVKVSKGIVKFNKKGTYKITYQVKGINKKISIKTVNYKVTDQRVKFALKKSKVTVNQGKKFDPYKYVKYIKTYKGKSLNKKKNVSVSGKVKINKPGTYKITYTAKYKNLDYTERTLTLKVKVKAVKKKPAKKPDKKPTTPEVTTVPETTTAPEVTTVPETTITPEETTITPEETTAPETTTTVEETTTM